MNVFHQRSLAQQECQTRQVSSVIPDAESRQREIQAMQPHSPSHSHTGISVRRDPNDPDIERTDNEEYNSALDVERFDPRFRVQAKNDLSTSLHGSGSGSPDEPEGSTHTRMSQASLASQHRSQTSYSSGDGPLLPVVAAPTSRDPRGGREFGGQ